MDFFNCPLESEPVALNIQHPTLACTFGKPLGNEDSGIGVESTMAPEMLSESLGFRGGLPLVFNKHQHPGGLTEWDHPQLFESSEVAKSSEMEAIVLHWHQLAVVHALVHMLFNEKPTPGKCLGVLIADEVGLGKTFQAATAIALFSDIVIWQEICKTRPTPDPPIIGNPPAYLGIFSAADSSTERLPYLGEDKQLPSLPHLIIVPGTLLSQWEGELKTLFWPKFFQILIYPAGKGMREHFWSAKGPFHGRKLRLPSNMIIVASHSICYLLLSATCLTLMLQLWFEGFAARQSPILCWDMRRGKRTLCLGRSIFWLRLTRPMSSKMLGLSIHQRCLFCLWQRLGLLLWQCLFKLQPR